MSVCLGSLGSGPSDTGVAMSNRKRIPRLAGPLLLAGLAGLAGWAAAVDLSRPSAAGASEGAMSIESSASAVASATRARRGGPVFPMEVAPRCDVLSNFGDPRSSGRTHQGIDMLSTLGQDIYAVTDGTLVAQFFVGGPQSAASGNAWRLEDSLGNIYFYAHLSAFAPGLAVGSKVQAGDVIGDVGDTGDPGAGNYHLHFEFRPLGGEAIDPLGILTLPIDCRLY